MNRRESHLYEFGPFRLDPAEHILLRGGEPVSLTPKAFETLVTLVERGGHLVEKDELLREVWPDAFVEEGSLARNVHELRKVLGEGASENLYIETVPKRGYRFVAAVRDLGEDGAEIVLRQRIRAQITSVEEEEELGPPGKAGEAAGHPAAGASPSLTRHYRHRRAAVATLALALAVAAIFVARQRFAARGEPIDSIAVLPFVNVGGDTNLEYLSDGISESLINSLSLLPDVKVIARSSSFKYKGQEVDPPEVANALGVQAIVTGRVVERGDQLQISVEMVDARDETQMWGAKYNRKAADLQAVQEEIARTISEKLRVRLTGAQEQQLAKRATENPEAYQLYLNGLFYFRKDGIDNVWKALDYFNQAVALDPKFAHAWAGVADVYRWLGGNSWLDSQEANAKAEAAVATALELDQSLAEVHRVLAIIKLNRWDWEGAEREYKRAVELEPNLSSAHASYAHYLGVVAGRHAEALAEIKRAQDLDPLRLGLRNAEATRLYNARRYEEAVAILQEVIRLEPDNINAHVTLGYTYAMKGRYAEAIAEYQKSMSLDKENTSDLCYMGYALAMSGKRSASLVVLNKLKTTKEYLSRAELAVLYVGLGDKEGALAELEKAYSAHDAQLQYLKADPHYDGLRSDPRFTDLIHRVGLPR